jgi:heme A synthase
MSRRTLVQLVVLAMLLTLLSGGTSAQNAAEPAACTWPDRTTGNA